jgi:RimJ/RimL family protein N-acetyltransferase
MEDRATGAFAGSVGAFRREPPPGANAFDDLEIGWSLVESFRGRGLATEATRAMVEHVFTTQKPPRVIAHIDHDNPPSIRVAEKLGMRYEREVPFYEMRLRRYVLER